MPPALPSLLSIDRGPGFPDCRPLRRGPDTDQFQGDGWRWTLSLLAPNVLLWRRRDGAPFTLHMLVLNRAQRAPCYAEWEATQREYAARAASAEDLDSCPHDTALIVATIGDPGNEDLDARGVPWAALPEGDDGDDWAGEIMEMFRQHFRPEGLDGISGDPWRSAPVTTAASRSSRCAWPTTAAGRPREARPGRRRGRRWRQPGVGGPVRLQRPLRRARGRLQRWPAHPRAHDRRCQRAGAGDGPRA
jgi:hypothetical protein